MQKVSSSPDGVLGFCVIIFFLLIEHIKSFKEEKKKNSKRMELYIVNIYFQHLPSFVDVKYILSLGYLFYSYFFNQWSKNSRCNP